MKILDIVVFEVTASREPQPKRQLQGLPLHIYPDVEHPNPPNKATPGAISAMYVEVQGADGISGIFGPIDRHQAFIIINDLRDFLIGRDALATEYLYDLMIRLNRHGRSGLFMTGVSAIDCALWDLKGKAWNQPIYRLLGGPTRSSLPAYASMLGFSVEPEEAARLRERIPFKRVFMRKSGSFVTGRLPERPGWRKTSQWRKRSVKLSVPTICSCSTHL